MTKAGKWKFGVSAGEYNFRARVGKYKLGARVLKYELGAKTSKHKLGARADKYKLGTRAGGREIQISCFSRNILIFIGVDSEQNRQQMVLIYSHQIQQSFQLQNYNSLEPFCHMASFEAIALCVVNIPRQVPIDRFCVRQQFLYFLNSPIQKLVLKFLR